MPLKLLGWNARWQAAFAEVAGAQKAMAREPAETSHDAGSTAAASPAVQLIPGRICGEHRSHFDVAIAGATIAAETPGRMWQDVEVRSDMPGVGDFVVVRPSAGDGPAMIEAVLPRTSALIRRAAGERRPQLIAANVDVVMIVTALDGDFSAERIARYLQVVRDGGAEAVIVINKADIVDGDGSDAVRPAVQALEGIAEGVPVHLISAASGAGVGDLEDYFVGGQTIALVGSSGVGKSTLTNRLLGRDAQVTQAVSAHDNRGRHTTTHRELFARPGGGSIMDTPGMGGLVIWEGDEEPEPQDDFEDVEALAAQCKFRNCAHMSEPKCAVTAAIERGEMTAERVNLYREAMG